MRSMLGRRLIWRRTKGKDLAAAFLTGNRWRVVSWAAARRMSRILQNNAYTTPTAALMPHIAKLSSTVS